MKCTKCGGEFEVKFCPWCGEPAGTAPPYGERRKKRARQAKKPAFTPAKALDIVPPLY